MVVLSFEYQRLTLSQGEGIVDRNKAAALAQNAADCRPPSQGHGSKPLHAYRVRAERRSPPAAVLCCGGRATTFMSSVTAEKAAQKIPIRVEMAGAWSFEQTGLDAMQAERAGLTPASGARTGAVTVVQRFGSAINLHVHLHIELPTAAGLRSGGRVDMPISCAEGTREGCPGDHHIRCSRC